MDKTCTRCGKPKPLSEFRPDKRYRLGVFCYCRACHDQKNKTWRTEHPEKSREISRISARSYRARAKENINTLARQRWATNSAYRQRRNQQKLAGWRRSEAIQARVRRANQLQAHKRRTWVGDDAVSWADWAALCARYDNRCLACKEQKPLTLDHVVPLSRGGRHAIENVQPLCLECNQRKGIQSTDYR